MELRWLLPVLTPYIISYPSSIPFGGPYAVPPLSYLPGSFGQRPPPPSMLPPGMAPVITQATQQLIDHTGWATATLGPVPTVTWSSGPGQSGPPTGPCHACGEVGHLHRHCLNKGVAPPLTSTTPVVCWLGLVRSCQASLVLLVGSSLARPGRILSGWPGRSHWPAPALLSPLIWPALHVLVLLVVWLSVERGSRLDSFLC